MLATKLKRIGVSLAVLPLVMTGFGVVLAAPANAAGGCGALEVCGGIGDGNGGSTTPPPPTGGNNGGSSGNGGANGGGGSSTPDPFAFTSRYPVDGRCAVRDDGKSALAYDVTYSKKFQVTTGAKPGLNWYFYNNSSGGNVTWARDYVVKRTCLYPSRSYKKPIACIVSFHAEVTRTKPNGKVLGTASANTGYKAGSRNYADCVSANANVSIKQKITEYGYYKVFTHSRVETVTFEIPYTKNGVTGKIDKPKALSSSGVYSTGKKLVMTGSLDCKNGWSTPGVNLPTSSYSAQLCQDDVKSGFVCVAPNPLVDVSETANGSRMRGFSGDVQMMRNGTPRKLTWGQSIKGNGVTVNSYQTQYKRSGTPWDSSKPVNANLVELATTPQGKSIWKNASETNWLSGKQSNVFVRGYAASNPGSKTTLTQNLKWAGTKRSSSVVITSINGKTGAVSTKTTTVNVPTGGSCSQSIGFEYLRAIGDVQ